MFPIRDHNPSGHRPHVTLALIAAGVDFQIRETFESAVEFGKAALMSVGTSPEDADAIALEIRRRDAERFELEMAGASLLDGAAMVYGKKPVPAKPTPTPFTKPKREAKALATAHGGSQGQSSDTKSETQRQSSSAKSSSKHSSGAQAHG